MARSYRFSRLWSEERGLTALLVLLLLSIVLVSPLSYAFPAFSVITGLLISLMLLAGIATMLGRWRSRAAFIVLSLFTILLFWTSLFTDLLWLDALKELLVLLSFSVITALVLWQVNRGGAVTAHTIRGAIAGYLLIGTCFAHAYELVELLSPMAFQGAAAIPHTELAMTSTFQYFSMVTLTTVGYGDITAIHPAARSLVMLEALIGQLYPAILIARLVTLELENKQAHR